MLDRWGLQLLVRRLPEARCRLQLWDGWTISCSDGPPVGTITIGNRSTLWRLLTHPGHPDLAFGEAYMNGAIDLTGDLTATMESLNLAFQRRRADHRRSAEARRLATSTIAAARKHVHHHYDLGNDFFRLWLDEAMVYTCAYFEEPGQDLEAAQQAKLDYICRKLQLRPGDRVIEAGCGWGALAIHMARRYHATVRAYNISPEQLREARAESVRQGVADRATFVDGDFRSITGECDVFVSVGMLEHVGLAEYGALGAVMDRVLDPAAGRGLLHFCGRNRPAPLSAWSERYIFPGGYPPTISEMATRVLEPWTFSVLDVENLRRHYALTLRHWRLRFEHAVPQVTRMFDDRFVRMWRLYLAAAEACFRSGDMQLFQVTFRRPTDDAGRWTRADLYARRPGHPRQTIEPDHAHV